MKADGDSTTPALGREARTASGPGRYHDKIGDRRLAETAPRQCLDDQHPFPGIIGILCQVLYGAAAAMTEMWARRRDPLRHFGEPFHRLATDAAAAFAAEPHPHRFSGQCERHINRAAVRKLADAVTGAADALNNDGCGSRVVRLSRHRDNCSV